MIGLIDDVINLNPSIKIILITAPSAYLIFNGINIINLGSYDYIGVLDLGKFQIPFLILATGLLINATNYIDGVDGLAISNVILFICGFEFFAVEQSAYSNLSSILIASIIPLYYFNFRKKNKVFLGDSGSLFLGGIISIYVITVLTNDYIISPEYDLHKILFVISILSYPIIDITRIFFLRLSKGKSPFKPDKNHIHHLVLKKKNNHLIATFLITGVSIFFLILIQIIF